MPQDRGCELNRHSSLKSAVWPVQSAEGAKVVLTARFPNIKGGRVESAFSPRMAVTDTHTDARDRSCTPVYERRRRGVVIFGIEWGKVGCA